MSTIATVTPVGKRYPQRIGTMLRALTGITGTASYATGGDTLTAKSLGLNVIDGGIMGTFNNHNFRVIPQTTGDAKIMVFVTSTGIELGNTVSWAGDVPFADIWGH